MLYDKLMLYRYYQIVDEHQKLRKTSSTPIQKYLKELKLNMDSHKFSGKDAILVFVFLIRMVEETARLIMSGDQTYILLPQFLGNPAATHLCAVQVGSLYSGVNCWLEAVQHILQM